MYYDDSSFQSPNASKSQEIRTDLQGKHNFEKCYTSPELLPPAATKETKATTSHFDPDNYFIGGSCTMQHNYVELGHAILINELVVN